LNPSTRISNLAELVGSLAIPPSKVVSSDDTVASGIGQLRKNNFEALKIKKTHDGGKPERPLAFSAYSVVSMLVGIGPPSYKNFLSEPCVEGALAVGTASDDSDIQSLCHVYETTTLGYALVHDAKKNADADENSRMVSVRDLLKLYQKKVIYSRLSLGDVASSPIFSLSRGTKLDATLAEMVRRKFRRVQLVGTKSVISDTQILAYLFGEERMAMISRKPERLLDGVLEDIEQEDIPWTNSASSLSDVASLLISKKVGCAMSEKGVATPWDLIVKPWRLGELRIN